MRESSPFVHGGYNTPGHVNLFHAPALDVLLSRAGLTMLDADGQYGGNPVELAAFFLGATGGAFDFLEETAPRRTMPEELARALTATLPAFVLFERMALLSPILMVVACRKGREHVFRDAIDARTARRRAQLAHDAGNIVAAHEAAERRLQDEIDRRDQLLRDQERHLQSEIQRRDRLLEQAHARLDSSLTARVEQKLRRLFGRS